MAGNGRIQRVPKRSWAFLNDKDYSNPFASTKDGGRKRKRSVSHLLSARKGTKTAFLSSYDSVQGLYSRLTEEDVTRIFETANISLNDYEFLIPSKSQRADTPPDGYITVYEEQITAGLRFPLHDLIVRVCDLIQVSPSQLAPNAYRAIVGFILCAKFYEIPATEASFSSLFQVMSAKVKGLFTFRPDVGCNFLIDKPVTNGSWKKKFFFLRRKGNSWNCITKWSEKFSRPTTDALLAEAAIDKGIMNHRFRANELTSKEILIHGGIEPGVPSPEFTFRFLMHKAAVTKFDLLPEDQPPASASAGKIRTSRLNINSSTTPLAAHTNPPTLIASSASLTQPRDEQLVNYQQLQSTPNDNKKAYLNEGAFTKDGGRKRKRSVSHLFAARKGTKNACSSLYNSVQGLYSRLTEEDVRRIFETANISLNDYEFLIPSESQRANTPPDGYITVYEEQITAGLRFPLHDLIVRVCDLIQVSPSQLVPNAYRAIVGFILCAKFYEIPATEASFSSLFQVMSAKVKGLFTFRPDVGCNFLIDKPVSNGPWKKKFFFLRRKGNSWNCITKWSETFSRPTTDALLAEAAIKKGIMNHRYRVNELTSKEILIHGGIEPGVPSPEFTFRFLMHKAAVTKFDLLPKDEPPTSASAGTICTIRLKMTSSTNPDDPQEGRREANSTVPVLDETEHQHIPPGLLTLWQSIESKYVQKDRYQELEKGVEELSSGLTYTKWRIQELEQELELSEARGVEYENRSSAAHRAMEIQSELIRNRDSELAYKNSRIQALDRELKVSEAKRVESEKQICLAAEYTKNIERKAGDIHRNLESELESTKSQIQELKGQLKVSEGKGVASEKKIWLANEDKKKLEKMVINQSDLNIVRDSELAYKESKIQELMLQLEESEAKRADSEKKIHLANEEIKKMEKRTENIHVTLDSKLESTKLQVQELTREVEKLTCFAYEDKENLEKRLEDQKSRDSELAHSKSQIQKLERALAISKAKIEDCEKKIGLANQDKKNLEKKIEYERARAKDDAVEEFKSSAEFLNMVQEKAYEIFDIKHLSFH